MEAVWESDITEYRNFLIQSEKSDSTINRYISDLKMFINWLGNRTIQKNLLIDYKNNLLGKYAIASVNTKLSSLNNFLTWKGLENLKVKVLKIQKYTYAVSDKELTKEEYFRLLNAARNRRNKQLYYVMQTICSTGIRVSELRFITVESLKKKSVIINLKSKIRQIFLPDDLCKMLLAYSKERKIEHGPVFITKNGTPIDRSNIWRSMKQLCKEAKVSDGKIFPHNLRHLFARTFYSSQKDIVRLSDILGHTSVNTTRIYTIESGDVHRRQIQNLGLIRIDSPQKITTT